MIKNMARVFLNGEMVENTKELGLTVFYMLYSIGK